MGSLLKPCSSWDSVDNWVYGDNSPNQVYDLKVPRNSYSSCPLIVFVHGGGWAIGTEDPSASVGIPFDYSPLVKRGFAFASVRYRLDAEAIWPAQIIDVLAAIRDIRAHAAVWRLYKPKVGIWGFSAGAHLAALAATAAGDSAFNQGNWLNTSPAVTVGLCDSPPTDFATWVATTGFETIDDPGQYVNTLFGGTVAAQLTAANAASPALRATSGAAPLLIRHGTADTQVPVAQARELRDAYQAAGVAVVLQEFTGAGHGTPTNTFYSAAAIKSAGDMFDTYLRP